METKMECEQYDMSDKMKKLFLEKQKQRAAAKDYFMKYLYNPHRPINEGFPFDPALQRFSAMSSYHVEYFKPTPASFAKYSLFLAPFIFVYWHVRHTREAQEKLIRSGAISYEDRHFKFAY